MDNKIIKIFSYPRSGSHLLMASLYYNYFANQNLSRNVSCRFIWNDDEGKHEKKEVKMKWSGLFGNHCLATGLSVDTLKSRIIYIYRDGRDAILSWWKLTKHEFPKKIDFNDWIKEHHIKMWWENVKSWIDVDYVFKVTYEDLTTNFEKTMRQIEVNFNLFRFQDDLIKPKKSGWSPGKGIVGDYKNIWNKENLEMFDKITNGFRVGKNERKNN